MHFLTDTQLAVAIINIISVIGNIYWTFRLKSIQVSNEVVKSLRESNQDKDEIIADVQKKKNQYKHQFQQQLYKNQEILGRLRTYEKMHSHPPDVH